MINQNQAHSLRRNVMSHKSKSILMIVLIATLLLSTACGSPAATTTPLAATATSTTARVQVATAAPDTTPTIAATATPDVPAERTAQLDALYYQQTADGAN